MKYWKNGFYEVPQGGAVEITDEYWAELLEGQSQGLTIEENREGYPVLTEYVPDPEALIQGRICELKALLSNTDYKAMKVVDGAITAQEYEPVKLQRAEWRVEINELEQTSKGANI